MYSSVEINGFLIERLYTRINNIEYTVTNQGMSLQIIKDLEWIPGNCTYIVSPSEDDDLIEYDCEDYVDLLDDTLSGKDVKVSELSSGLEELLDIVVDYEKIN